MKKSIVLTAALLLCFLAHSQEANNPGRTTEMTIIPRLDLNPHFNPGVNGKNVNFRKDMANFSLGNTSLYSLFEGNISENLSFSICNHWLSVNPKELYKKTLRSDYTNWLDWLNFTYTAGGFSFTVGKDMVTTGGFEFDDYDFDVHTDLCSNFWHNFSSYQWGGKIAYTTNSENTSIALQMSTSPFGERPFASDLFNYSVQWRGNYGSLRTLWSATAIQTASKNFQYLFSLGQQVDIWNITLGTDYMNKVGDEENIIIDGTTLLGTIQYTDESEKWELKFKGGYEKIKERGSGYMAGVAAHWFPLKKSKDLRLHISVSYNNTLNSIGASIGAIYYFNLRV